VERHRLALMGSVLRVTSLVATTLVALFLMPFLVHRLGDKAYGYWTLIGAVLGYYGILDLGIGSAVQYQVAKALGDRNPDTANRIISTAFHIFAAVGIFIFLSTVVLAAFARTFITNNSDVHIFRAVLVTVGIGFALGFPGRAFVGALSAHLRLDLCAAVSILVLIIRTTLIVVVIGRGGGIISLAVIALLTDILTYTCYYLLLRTVQANLRISPALASFHSVKELFHYSWYSLIIQLSDQLRFSIDGWMVGIFVGVSAVTHYAIGSRLSQAFMALLIAILGILSPWFSQLWGSSDLDAIRRVFVLGTRAAATISTIIACTLIFYGRPFIAVWMGTAYLDAYWPLVLLVSAIFIDVSQQPSVSYLYGVSRHRFLAFLTLAEAVANVGLSIFWARKYGLFGVALGTLVPIAVAKVFIQPGYVCRHLQLSLKTYYLDLLGRSIVPTALSSFLLWVFVFRKLTSSNVVTICAMMVLQALMVAAVAFVFAFNKNDKNMLLGKILPMLHLQRRTALGESLEIN
jgi:O-antigen/teichoic acid export membrane protein